MSTLGIFNFYGTAGSQCVFVYDQQSIVPPTKPPDSVPVPRSDVKLYQLTRRRGFLKRWPWLFYTSHDTDCKQCHLNPLELKNFAASLMFVFQIYFTVVFSSRKWRNKAFRQCCAWFALSMGFHGRNYALPLLTATHICLNIHSMLKLSIARNNGWMEWLGVAATTSVKVPLAVVMVLLQNC